MSSGGKTGPIVVAGPILQLGSQERTCQVVMEAYSANGVDTSEYIIYKRFVADDGITRGSGIYVRRDSYETNQLFSKAAWTRFHGQLVDDLDVYSMPAKQFLIHRHLEQTALVT
jgi:hypothetical protein